MRAFKYIVINNYGLCGSNYSWEGMSGSLRERERESKADSAVFEWLGARARARARTANAVVVPAGMLSLVPDSGVILFVSGVSNMWNSNRMNSIKEWCPWLGTDVGRR